MKGSIQIAKVAGIPIKLHWTFVLVFVWVAFEGLRIGMNTREVTWFAGLVLGVFVCVVLHELGHALTARKYGVKTRDIILSIIGGVARLDRFPEKPLHESLVVMAGPAVNLVLAILIGGYGWLTSSIDFTSLGTSRMILGNPESFLTLFFLINLFLAIINLIPVFPMDGGRIFRSLLSIQMGRKKATLVTTSVGQGLAVLIGILAYYFLPKELTLYLIPLVLAMSIFMFYVATKEYEMVKFEDILKSHSISELVRSPINIFQKKDNVQLAVDALNEGVEKDFIVKNEDGTIVGVLAETVISKLVKNNSILETSFIENFITPITEGVSTRETLHDFYKKMVNQQLHILPVYENEQFIGVVDIQQLNDFLEMKEKVD